MILLISDLNGGDLWCKILADEAMEDIDAMPTDGPSFRLAMESYLGEDGPGNRHVVREFGLQSPVILRKLPPLDGIKIILFLS